MKHNISKLKDCYGCGVCVVACPVKIITLKENADGFYSPIIEDSARCIECGICLKVCAFNHRDIADSKSAISAYAGWSKNSLTRQWCSSGGIGFELGRYLLNKKYKAVGVRFDSKKNRAEHFIASDEETYMPSVGSKYLPSYTADAFSAITRKGKYLITGTPCQIDSFRRYIQHFKVEDNFILMDFFCHGVPSLLMWDAYTTEIKKKIGEITWVSWRNKTVGRQDAWSINVDSITPNSDLTQTIDWHDSYNLKIEGRKHLYASRCSQGDLFYKFFLGDYCMNECCYKCKYKKCHSAADIRIGDLWGPTYSNNQKGVSGVLVFTERGKTIIEELHDTCEFISHSPDVVTEGQLSKSVKRPWIRDFILKALHNKTSLPSVNSRLIKFYLISILPMRAYRKIINILNRYRHG